ncbi:hypothetical protein EYF80_023991 [Liparis tanakae]|uniref:Uncharacterized protein n=1 Tax=Liparis tanakae TaxID=230148 RepID=A0A4Z2HIU8_9TELE|nr:hypothetical protein EYF80_023991 [Liparis tanakae]
MKHRLPPLQHGAAVVQQAGVWQPLAERCVSLQELQICIVLWEIVLGRDGTTIASSGGDSPPRETIGVVLIVISTPGSGVSNASLESKLWWTGGRGRDRHRRGFSRPSEGPKEAAEDDFADEEEVQSFGYKRFAELLTFGGVGKGELLDSEPSCPSALFGDAAAVWRGRLRGVGLTAPRALLCKRAASAQSITGPQSSTTSTASSGLRGNEREARNIPGAERLALGCLRLEPAVSARPRLGSVRASLHDRNDTSPTTSSIPGHGDSDMAVLTLRSDPDTLNANCHWILGSLFLLKLELHVKGDDRSDTQLKSYTRCFPSRTWI